LGADFPYGTLAVNLLGSLLIGAVMEMSVAQGVIGEDWRLVLTTGLLGGFTTYSAFSHETLAYFTRGAYATGGLYLGATLLGCFAAGLLGISVSRAFG